MTRTRFSTRRFLVAAASVGAVVGAAVGGFAIAGAATTPSAATGVTTTTTFQGNENPTHESAESGQREADEKSGKAGFGGRDTHGNESPVTGATADKVKAAALSAVPGTVTKTEQRADGTYEAEITKADGSEVHVSLDKSFTVTSTNSRSHDHSDGRPEGPTGA